MKRKMILGLCLALVCMVAFAQGQTQLTTPEYPTRSIDFIIASSAGSGGDVLTRLIAKYMSEELKVGINVLNQGGGNGIPAVQAVLSAKTSTM